MALAMHLYEPFTPVAVVVEVDAKSFKESNSLRMRHVGAKNKRGVQLGLPAGVALNYNKQTNRLLILLK